MVIKGVKPIFFKSNNVRRGNVKFSFVSNSRSAKNSALTLFCIAISVGHDPVFKPSKASMNYLKSRF